jgi:hypothetical protein
MKEKTLPDNGTHFAVFCKRCTILAAIVVLSATAQAEMPTFPNVPEIKTTSVRLMPSLSKAVENIKGKVTDEKGDALPGVSILLKGTQQGTSSDAAGNFSIDVPSSNAVLVFSFVGYTAQEVQVGSRTTLEIRLVTESKALDEVVVTALGIRRETKSLGYSVTKIKIEILFVTNDRHYRVQAKKSGHKNPAYTFTQLWMKVYRRQNWNILKSLFLRGKSSLSGSANNPGMRC